MKDIKVMEMKAQGKRERGKLDGVAAEKRWDERRYLRPSEKTEAALIEFFFIL